MPLKQLLVIRTGLNGRKRRGLWMHPRDIVAAFIVRPKWARITKIRRSASI
jgi:hypothetical protein